jgi:hypothetical protein
MKVLTVPQSGRCGPIVYVRSRCGLVARQWVKPLNPRTEPQQYNRRGFATVSKHWGGLDDDQRNSWCLFAVGKYTLNALGVQVPRSGYSCFMSINLRQAHLGLPLFDLPPAPPVIGPNPVGELVATNTGDTITLKVRVPSAPAQYTLLQGAAPQASGVRFVQHFPFLGLVPPPVDGWSDITALYVARYGMLQAGRRIFIRTCQQMDGMADVPKLTSVRIPAATP